MGLKAGMATSTAAEKGLYFVSNFSTLDLVDRERLTSCLMTLIRKDHEVHQRGKKRFQLVVLMSAEAGGEQRFDAADNARGPYRRLRRGFGGQFARLIVKAARKVVQKLDPPLHRGFAGCPRLDHESAGGVWFPGRKPQQCFEPVADPVTPDVASLPDGRLEFLAQSLGAAVEGGEEAVFFVGEVFVEGRTGDAGA